MKRLLIVALLFPLCALAQDPKRFQEEIDKILIRDSAELGTNAIIFAGSSSFRMWSSLQADFPNHHVLNHGFGGSETSDLVHYANELIIRFKPSQIFIYEGDNDLNAGKNYKQILSDADKLIKIIRRDLPTSVEVVYLTPKPSPSRWKLHKEYEQFNRKLKRWARKQDNVKVADVWKAMLNEDHEPIAENYIDDKLHMNKKGYDIWVRTIGPYLK